MSATTPGASVAAERADLCALIEQVDPELDLLGAIVCGILGLPGTDFDAWRIDHLSDEQALAVQSFYFDLIEAMVPFAAGRDRASEMKDLAAVLTRDEVLALVRRDEQRGDGLLRLAERSRDRDRRMVAEHNAAHPDQQFTPAILAEIAPDLLPARPDGAA